MVEGSYLSAAWWVFLCLCCYSQGRGPHSESHFRQALPITDHTAAFKDLNKHQRQLCDLAFLSEDYNLWSFTPTKKKNIKKKHSHLFPQPPLIIFQTHWGFRSNVHHSGRAPLSSCCRYLVVLMGSEYNRDKSNACINECGCCSKIIYFSY